MNKVWSALCICALTVQNLFGAQDVVDKEYAKFVVTTGGQVAVRGTYVPMGISTNLLPAGMPEREANKFAVDSNGNVAVRCVIPDLPAYATTGQVSSAVAAYSNAVKSTALGSEGMRLVGTLGGYTLDELFEATGLRGASRDCPVFTYSASPATNLVVSWSAGDVYSPEDGYFHLTPDGTTLTDNSVNYAYWNVATPTQVKWTTTRPLASNNIVLASFVTAFGQIVTEDLPEPVGEFPLNTRAGAARLAPSLVNYGMEYSGVATNLNGIVMTAGEEYHDIRTPKEYNTLDLRTTNVLGIMTYGHTNAGVWGMIHTNQFPLNKWDNGSAIVACISTTTNWYKGLFLAQEGSKYMHYVYPQATYTSEVDAITGADPSLPPGFTPYVPMCTAYIFCGTDTVLRTSTTDWVDRRFQWRRPGSVVVSGGSAATPSLDLVMLAGSSLGGILPRNAGLPTLPDQLTSKAYVDSMINNINASKVYVDADKGSNQIAQIESSILPFKTIQAAIDAAASQQASSSNHFTVVVSGGNYYENISMSNYVGVRSEDMEGTVIYGTVTYPPTYTDQRGAELALLSVFASNAPALVVNVGDDNAYVGGRSCYFKSSYYDGETNRSVVQWTRGLIALYATTYCELQALPTNSTSGDKYLQIFEHCSDPANPGLSQFTSFNSSCLLNTTDTNDTIALIRTHDNTDAKCINTLLGTMFDCHLDTGAGVYTNNIKLTLNQNAAGRTLSMGTVTRMYLGYTNGCNVFLGYSSGGPTDNVAIVRGNHVRMPAGSTSNIWLGAATGVNDRLRVYDSVYIQNYTDYPYPTLYTNAGAAGKFFVNTVTENGDQLFGGSLDISAISTPGSVTHLPATGHLKLYAGTYAGIESPYFKDSSGNTVRMSRDNFYNGFNDDTVPMPVGTAVYISSGLSADNTPKVKRSIANDISTLPCVGVVAQLGGIATGAVGRIMIMGRLESGMDTSMFTSGQKIYLSETIKGGLTNVAPSGTNVAQIIATAHVIGTNGYLNVRPWAPDTLGSLTPGAYALSTRTNVWEQGAATATAVSNYAVSASITNGILSSAKLYTDGATQGLVTASITNGILSAANTFTTNAVTNISRNATFASNTVVAVSNYAVSASITNGILVSAKAYTDGATQGLVTASVTNGILSSAKSYTDGATQGLVTVSVTNGILSSAKSYTDSATQGLVTASITNGILVSAKSYTDSATQNLVTASITNGILSTANTFTTNWVTNVSVNATWASNGVVALTTTSRFKAGLGTNVTYAANKLTLMPMTNLMYNSGVTSYSNTLARWYPNITNKLIEFIGGYDFGSGNNGAIVSIYIYKNGAYYSRVVGLWNANNNDVHCGTWLFIDSVNTSTNDYYEMYLTNSSPAFITSGTSSNNWWTGVAE